MPVYYARKAGNVNATDVWATTPTGTAGNFFSSFTSADSLMANGFGVTVNTSVTVAEIRTDSKYGAADGGSFGVLNTSVTITANLFAGGTNACVSIQGTQTVTVVGAVYGGYGGGAQGALWCNGNLGTVNLIGNAFGGTTSQSSAILMRGGSTLTVNITGNIYAGRGGNAHGLLNDSINGAGSLNITGDIFGAPAGGSSGVGVIISTIPSVSVVGTATGGITAGMSVGNVATTVNVSRAKGGPFLSSGVGVASSTAGSLASVTVNSIEFGELGFSPTSGPIRFPNSTAVVAFVVLPTGSRKLLADSTNAALYPSASDVRSGIAYATSSAGTCAIPAASNVLSGVPVDAGVGTGSLTAAALWNHLASASTTSGSMGERLANVATVASTGQQIANAVGA